MKKIIVLFKTHLDIGFTDRADRVVQNYMESYIPGALRVAEELRGEPEGFIWTTGSWLIEKYLEEGAEKERLEEAVRRGEIRWHGLPFTTQTELMDSGLFEYGIGISKKLDERFGVRTTAAKLTDVPGHTRSMIPMMEKAGLRFLHIGVNPASHPPCVPELFWWEDLSGARILVMYNHDYGELTEIGNSGCAVYFAHTGDNHGPQSAESIRKVYRELHEAYPEAKIAAGTLEDAAKIALSEEGLPVVKEEIGDSWIYGAGSDPWKVGALRALLRLAKKLPEEERSRLYRELLLIPEHTWGRDEKTCLGKWENGVPFFGEHNSFAGKDFERARATDDFLRLEDSWKEQREYVRRGIEALSYEYRAEAYRAVGECRRLPYDTDGLEELEAEKIHEINGWQVKIGGDGSVRRLEKDGKIWADEPHPAGLFYYEVFSENEYDSFQKQYVTHRWEWALEDFGKIGMKKAIERHCGFYAQVRKIYRCADGLIVRMELPEEAAEKYGGMELLEMKICLEKDSVDFDFAWFGKHACRIAEASWLLFCPPERVEGLEKLGQWVRPDEVVPGGSQRLHAVGEGVRFETLELETKDAPLVNVGAPSLLTFPMEKPPIDQGVAVNLHNNIWGTNYPMWYEEEARFGFTLNKRMQRE